MSNLLNYTLRIADNAMILGQRMSQWCSNGPTLEEDIAMVNISLDLFGQANGFYEYASSVDGTKSADDFAFLRSEREYLNNLIVEQKNGHFGDTIVRNFLFDVYTVLFYTKLGKSKDEILSALGSKSLKEAKYHLRHSSNWLIRLGDGTQESKGRVQKSLNNIWMFTGNLFEMDVLDSEMASAGIGVDNIALKSDWDKKVNEILDKAKLSRPKDAYMQTGSKNGIHTEHLGHLLSEMQYLQRAHPNAKW
jgi:ring-1,2-phenylacetyl-CoA epoxidase subunit PaaC